MSATTTGLRPYISLTADQLLTDDEILVIVDDEEAIRESLQLYFEQQNFPVKTATNGRELTELLDVKNDQENMFYYTSHS